VPSIELASIDPNPGPPGVTPALLPESDFSREPGLRISARVAARASVAGSLDSGRSPVPAPRLSSS